MVLRHFFSINLSQVKQTNNCCILKCYVNIKNSSASRFWETTEKEVFKKKTTTWKLREPMSKYCCNKTRTSDLLATKGAKRYLGYFYLFVVGQTSSDCSLWCLSCNKCIEPSHLKSHSFNQTCSAKQEVYFVHLNCLYFHSCLRKLPNC